ncbi:hypothetical protein ABOM_012196 [Aspergillus bombycis]|uniref:Aminoglycoside phosphotransferase domain-containing protein n=1 Tax=Aspergillus bombycis TaxID=109264 RepID=A0A1F7ZID2_9EURO|nr:hypothetical protein ABOM_012196 [Aspergillus bombycis]OGM39212.1 hypothetical protein ABOM_012196 [Aspergillus bombycis]
MSRVRKSKAARFNAHVLKKLQTAVAMDPELDLTTQLPSAYSGRLGKMRETVQSVDDVIINTTSRDDEDIRTTFDASIQAEIVHPLSQEVLELLSPGGTKVSPVRLSQRLLDIMRTSEVIWKAPFARHKIVLKCGNNIVLKVIRNMDDYTEYTTLQYLRQHRPNVPVPEPSGLVRVNDISLVFMTHISSNMLADVWSILNSSQKTSIKEQLAAILLDLRSIPFTPGAPLGGVGGEGCKDIRRHLRRSEAPILSASEFEDFLYTGSHEGGQVFVKLLRQLAPPISAPSSPAIVFTHGDLRPNNIAVTMKDGTWVIAGLIDWEYSGFYPEYYEAVRCTNCLAPYEDNDWFLFLPDCVSPKAYSHWWLLDRVRETRLV